MILMKRILTVGVEIWLFLLLVTPVIAKTNPNKVENVNKFQKETRILEREAKKRTLIRAFVTRRIVRLTAMIERIEKLITRIESRIKKLETAGNNVTSVNVQLSKAKDKLAGVKTNLGAVRDSIDTTLGLTTPKDEFKELTTKLETVKKDLVEVHRMLVEIIGDIKGLRL